MAIDNAKNLFLHELADIYDGERQIAQILPKLAGEVDDDRLRDAFQEHEGQTKEHIRNLERCFELMGAAPGDVVCHVVRALSHEHEMISKQSPPPELLTRYDLSAGSKTEHYEIAAYQDLVSSARSLGESEVADLLEENLRQETAMEETLQRLRDDYEQELLRKTTS